MDKAIIESFTLKKQHLIKVAMGVEAADTVFKNAMYLNLFSNEMCKGDIAVKDGIIVGIGENYNGNVEIDMSDKVLLPGFIDSHIHIESSAVTPREFAKIAVQHGTTAVITDPHEIANVLGTDGIDYMLKASENLPIDFYFCMPSCVPATPFEMGGAKLSADDIAPYFENERVVALAEMMNYVGTVNGEQEVIDKISVASAYGKTTDGHAPGINEKTLNAYITAGAYTDHECSELRDAKNKLMRGQKILIREGTAAKNLVALVSLLSKKYGSSCMLASDDKHPDDLINLGHIDHIIKKAIALGADPFETYKAATINAANHYGLGLVGAIAPGYRADLIIADDAESLNILSVYKNGVCVFDGNEVIGLDEENIPQELKNKVINTFNMETVTADKLKLSEKRGLVGLVEGQIITENLGFAEKVDTEEDVLKVAVIERHRNTGDIGIGFLKGYGLKKGAVATSIAHDSHNLIVIGENDADMVLAANRVKEMGGGIAVAADGAILGQLSLPIAGLMSDKDLVTVRNELEEAKEVAYKLGVNPKIDPFMTLSFVSLPVIPEIRITTGGVFDVNNFKYI